MTDVKRKKRWWLMGAVFLIVLAAGGAFYMKANHAEGIAHGDHTHASESELWTCSMHPFIIVDEPGDCPVCGMDLIPKPAEAHASELPTERKIAYWRAPMNPQEIYDEPGQSAMGMELVPVYEDELVGGVMIAIDPVVEQNMGVRLSEAIRAPLTRSVHTWGHVTFDQTRTWRISPRFSGWIQTLDVSYEGQKVKGGEPLFSVYSPELIAAQEEYLNARRSGGKSDTAKRLLASARRKLMNYGVADSEIARAEAMGRALETVTVFSPGDGVVLTKSALEGGYFKAGAELYTLSDLSRVWVEAHVYEYEVGRITVGQKAMMNLPFGNAPALEGAVTFVSPVMAGQTRDLSVRLEFDNNEGLLKPDMYANVTIETDAGAEGIVIPTEAILRSGSRSTVFVRTAPGRYTPRLVTTGPALDGGHTQILTGIAPGEQVVTSGQFLLDSESQLKEAVTKMMEANNPKPPVPEEAPKKEGENDDDDFFDDF